MANRQIETAFSMLPYSIIKTACSGDADAINAVLKHFERYMITLTTRTLYDNCGNPYLCVDEEMKRRLETKLITKILSFDAQKVA